MPNNDYSDTLFQTNFNGLISRLNKNDAPKQTSESIFKGLSAKKDFKESIQEREQYISEMQSSPRQPWSGRKPQFKSSHISQIQGMRRLDHDREMYAIAIKQYDQGILAKDTDLAEKKNKIVDYMQGTEFKEHVHNRSFQDYKAEHLKDKDLKEQ